MTRDRSYPSPAVSGFPAPPHRFTDGQNRDIVIETIGDDPTSMASLVEMYDEFDPADRAQGIPPVRREEIEEWLELILPEGVDLVARHGDRSVGHATLVPDGSDECELAIFVHQDYRGARIGSTLLRTLLGAAAEVGIEHIWLTVERWNTVAIRLYESVGFERTGGGSFELEMTIRLNSQTDNTG